MATAQTKTGKRILVSPGSKGAISEHLATAWLLAKGYDVFRNVSPNGRADLLAVDWVNDETIRVDVKSDGFDLCGTGAISAASRETAERNKGFSIKYLIVKKDGDCEWYKDSEKAADNDNSPPEPTWWVDKKSGQRFHAPGNAMTNKDWTFFCHWLLRAYPDVIFPFSEVFVREISARGIGCDRPRVEGREFTVLEKIRKHVFAKLVEQEAIELKFGITL